MVRFSATVSLPSRLGLWKTTPILRRSAWVAPRKSQPRMRALPDWIGIRVESSLKRVLLPPPLGPRKPKISPRAIVNSTVAERLAIAIAEAQVRDLDRGLGGLSARRAPLRDAPVTGEAFM